ncbi:restriction endonuclease subunit S [Chryseobacterium pennae]|uniref:Restriction endonuclease subunit S n=2 Tax=Chryseobacterium pennae TaxID=2258962 RepID=A0A3D9C7W0_9FLAO|nr:restriction endonuclease subunit S [Chryseobacterium pennae]
MTRTGNTGQVVTNVSGAFHNNFFKVAYPEYIIKNFLLNFLKSNKIQNQIIRLAGTSTIPDLNHSDFYKIKIIFPSTQEQKKISTLLSLLAQRIQTQKKIIEDNRKMKLELSHSLFTRSLKINQRYISKWEEKKLGDISTILMGQSPDSLAYNTDGKGLPLIQGNADIVQRFSEPRQFTSQITKTCDIGDIILTVRAPVGYVAKSKHFACIGRGVCAIKSNEKSDSEFIYQFLLYFENKWASFEQGSTFTSVNRSDIKTIKLNIPTIKEQKEIAKFLKAFDEKIKLEAELLNQYENQKKYLLQNLFV